MKIPGRMFYWYHKLFAVFVYKKEGTKIAKTILKKRNKVVGLILANFKAYAKAVVIQAVSYRQKDRHIHHWNGIKIPVVSCKWQLVFDKGAKTIQEEIIVFSISGARCHEAKKNFTLTHTHTFYKTQLKCKFIESKLLEVKGIKFMSKIYLGSNG